MKDGGLGVRRVSSLAIPACLASAASTLNLQDDILSGSICSNSHHMQSYLTAWSTAYDAVPDTLPSKQPFWDRPGILADRAIVESSLTTPLHRASFLAAASPHNGDWLFTMPITLCGLRLDDEAVRVGVGLRLGLSLCVPHQCQCGSLVSSAWVHSFVCKKAPGRTARPHALNDLIARTLVSAGIPVTLRWQTSGRPHFGAVERGQTPYLGRNCRLHCGRLLCERFSQRGGHGGEDGGTA